MNTLVQNVNAVEELVFAMMLTSGAEVAGRSIVFYMDCQRFHSEHDHGRVAGRHGSHHGSSRQPNHHDACTQNSSTPSCRVHTKRGSLSCVSGVASRAREQCTSRSAGSGQFRAALPRRKLSGAMRARRRDSAMPASGPQTKQHSRSISLSRVKQTLTRRKRSVFLESETSTLSGNMSTQRQFVRLCTQSRTGHLLQVLQVVNEEREMQSSALDLRVAFAQGHG